MRMNFQEYAQVPLWFDAIQMIWDATFSTEISSKVLVFWLYQCLSSALESPIATSKYELFSDNLPKVNSKYCENDRISSWVWLEDL